MRRTMAILLALVLCLLTGCGGKQQGPLPDTYVPGSDFQLYLYSNDNRTSMDVQEGDGVIYLYYKNYVYYLDEETGVILPLCNKADCLHNLESDPEMVEKCNAYVGAASIQYCNGYLYALRTDGPELDNCILQRISANGSRKDIVYEWDESEKDILYWLVHRDVMYYQSTSAITDPSSLETRDRVCAMDLTARQAEPKIIYDPSQQQECSAAMAGYYLLAYGNHLYIDYSLAWEQDENYSEETQFNYMEEGIKVYDITTGEMTDIQMDLPYGVLMMSPNGIWQDKLLLAPYDATADDEAPQTCYTADLDGTNVQPLMEKPNLTRFFGDEKYLYITDSIGWPSPLGTYHDVYDSDLNKIDTFTVPDFFKLDLPVGTAQRVIQIFTSTAPPSETSIETIRLRNGVGDYPEGGSCWGVMIWDKSKIGTYNGGEISFDMIFA